MKNIRKSALGAWIIAGLAAAAVAVSGSAGAAPTGVGNAHDTIRALESEGNRVVVNRLSDAPLMQASVISMQAGADLPTVGKVVYVAVR